MNIIIALILFSLIVIFHELGHFLLAKKNGIGVVEFSIGMGPRLITAVKTEHGMSVKFFASSDDCMSRADWKDHTKYSWKLFPIGGSCMMLGEDEVMEDANAFNNKGVWARISVIFAGPFFNFILAFIIAAIIIGVNGYDPAKITEVQEGSPMAEAGFQEGDIITRLNGQTIHSSKEISDELNIFNPLNGEPVDITVKRDGEKIVKSVVPRKNEEGNYKLGFTYAGREKTNAWGVIKYSVYEVKYWIVTTVRSLGMLITGKVGMNELAGPVGIVDLIGNQMEVTKSYGIGVVLLNLLNMALLLSANLGVMNLLPIPALDGGRLVFLIIEAIRKKPVDRDKEAMVHMIGLIALMVLMVFILFNDVGRIINR